MFWLLRFRGETLGATLALWINAITWQIQKLFYKISYPNSTKQHFIKHIFSKKLHLHWTRFPFNIEEKYYHDSKLRLWMDAIGISWAYFSHPADHPAEWLSSIGAGQIGFDIGGHRGYWAVLYQSRVLPGGIIFSFEPNPNNYHKMIQNLGKNKVGNVVPLRLAAWREKRLLSIKGASAMGIESFLSRVEEDEDGNILAVTIDELVDSLGLPRLDWIKMDIEGAEVEALKGAMKTLSRYRPTLWIEFHDTLEELKALLAEANYEIKGEVHYEATPYHRDPGYLWAVPRTSTS